MTIQTPQDLLTYELQTIEDAEKRASEALPQMMQSVENGQLRTALEQRLKQGERLLKDVQRSLDKLDGKGRGTQNAAARGLIQETERLMKEVRGPDMQQAVLIDGVQKLEHYCIAAWGTVKAMAQECGEEDLAKAMDRALSDGYQLDEKLTKLAEARINPAALGGE